MVTLLYVPAVDASGACFVNTGALVSIAYTSGEVPLTPAYPAASMLAVVQFTVLLVTVAASVSVTLASHSVNPGLGAVVILVDQPLGTGVNAPVAQVYVLVPLIVGIVTAH